MADKPDKSQGVRKPRKDWHEDWVRVYAQAGTVSKACEAVGISRETAYQHRKRFAEFAAAWDREENSVTDQLEKTLVEVALHGTGSPQVRALDIALRSRRPAKYRDNATVEHTGQVEHIGGFEREVAELTEKLRENAESQPNPSG